MKTKALVFATVAMCLTSSAFAQSYDYRGGDRARYDNQYRSDRYDREERYSGDDRYHDQRYYNDERFGRSARDNGRHEGERHRVGAGPDENLFSGSRLPMAFWSREYRINDWRRAHLAPPLPGHNWVRVGNDFAMVSVSTGLISRIVVD